MIGERECINGCAEVELINVLVKISEGTSSTLKFARFVYEGGTVGLVLVHVLVSVCCVGSRGCVCFALRSGGDFLVWGVKFWSGLR